MKNIKLLMSASLLVCCAMLMWKCQTTEDDSVFLDIQTEQTNRIVNKISFQELPFDLQKEVTLLDEVNTMNKSSQEELLFMNLHQIMSVTDSMSNTKYSIKFTLPNQPENVLYNLILGHDSNNQETNPYIIKYTIANMDDVYSGLEADFTKMRGKITTHSFSSLMDYIEHFDSENRTIVTLEEDDCPDYSNEDGNTSEGNDGSSGGGNDGGSGNGGDGNSDDGGSGDDLFDFPHFEDTNDGSCNINVWSNGTTGEVIGITWSCTDG